MYSVKPGRGPSLMGGVGGIVAVLVGIVWTVGAVSMGAPFFIVLFGLLFIGVALAGAAYNFYNATNRNRVSTFDITTDSEEADPVAHALGHDNRPRPAEGGEPAKTGRKFPGQYCPFCGTKAGPDFNYCPKCGKDI